LLIKGNVYIFSDASLIGMEEIVRRAKSVGVEPLNYARDVFQKLVLYANAYLEVDDYYVLQGGTALRLFYGSPRFSLDLDFTSTRRTPKSSVKDFKAVASLLERLLAPYNIDVSLSGERLSSEDGLYRSFLVFDTSRSLKRKVRIKVEVVSRSYRDVDFNRGLVIIDFPFSTSISAVTKSSSQLLADKIASLAGGYHKGYVRWRDVFDAYWLLRYSKAKLDHFYLFQEFGTFVEEPEDLLNLIDRLNRILFEKSLSDAKKDLGRLLNRSMLEDKLIEEYVGATLEALEEAYRVVKK